MQEQNRNAIFGDFAVLSTLVILFTAALALVGCGGGGGSTAPNDPASPPPCYSADEPFNDSFFTTELISSDAELFLVEGYIHHQDADCMIVAPVTPIAGRMVSVNYDYAGGWQMQVSLGYRTASGELRTLWAREDDWGIGGLSGMVEMPVEAVDITLAIDHQNGNSIPDSTRYTAEVEVF